MKRSAPLRRKTRMKPVSTKRQLQNVLYRAVLSQWRAQHDGRCEMRVNIYTGQPMPRGATLHSIQCPCRADDAPHHSKGRGRFLCDISTFRGLCRRHHNFIHHENPNLARALGWLEF